MILPGIFVASRMCLYFDYVLDGEGSIEVSTTDSTGNESNIVNLSGTQETWTTKATYIDSRHAINMVWENIIAFYMIYLFQHLKDINI